VSGAPASRAEFVCIACPMGCPLNIVVGSAGNVSVSGNRCPRGETYGQEELLSPRRIVTAVVPTDSADFPCAPVRTDVPLARALVPELLRDLYGRTVSLPVRVGQVLVQDFHGTRVMFTRTLPPDDVSPVGEAGAEPEGQDEVALL